MKENFADKNIVILGGLGFIGSNMAIRLIELGANVTLVDSMLPQYGGNLFNIESIKDKCRINFSDIRDEYSLHVDQDAAVLYLQIQSGQRPIY